ncbi:MAG: patatin-like phospholipase family protein [Phycisphaeraceae bacterium]|nr:patatin-like phospholipase family protein [Phycisphaeraceae bacterium]MCW5763636.1 patatin-like phospholipase family protein [Phycisphaeraceae bacterium]
MRRGLVLEGGGAKGAYSMGAIQACHDHKLDFDIIAGTSVGALNGAMFANGAIDEGVDLWRSLTFDRVARFRSPSWFWIPAVLAANFTGKYTPFAAWSRLHNFEILVWAFLMLAFMAGAVREIVSVFGGGAPDNLLLGITLFLSLLAIRFGPHLVLGLGASALDPGSLRDEATRILASKRFAKPLFATTGNVEMMLDPDDAHLMPMDDYPDSGYVPLAKACWIPTYVRVDQLEPHERIRALMASAALPFGIFPATAIRKGNKSYVDGGLADNLPWRAIFEMCDEIIVIRLRPGEAGEMSVEGLVSHWKQADRLRRLAAMSPKDRERLYYRMVCRKDEADARGHLYRSPPVAFPEQEPVAVPSRVIFLSPAVPLESLIPDSRHVMAKRSWLLSQALRLFKQGGWAGDNLRGTMNFERSATRRWLRHGYKDMAAAIEQYQLTQPISQ